jgi:hypothetical protein
MNINISLSTVNQNKKFSIIKLTSRDSKEFVVNTKRFEQIANFHKSKANIVRTKLLLETQKDNKLSSCKILINGQSADMQLRKYPKFYINIENEEYSEASLDNITHNHKHNQSYHHNLYKEMLISESQRQSYKSLKTSELANDSDNDSYTLLLNNKKMKYITPLLDKSSKKDIFNTKTLKNYNYLQDLCAKLTFMKKYNFDRIRHKNNTSEEINLISNEKIVLFDRQKRKKCNSTKIVNSYNSKHESISKLTIKNHDYRSINYDKYSNNNLNDSNVTSCRFESPIKLKDSKKIQYDIIPEENYRSNANKTYERQLVILIASPETCKKSSFRKKDSPIKNVSILLQDESNLLKYTGNK